MVQPMSELCLTFSTGESPAVLSITQYSRSRISDANWRSTVNNLPIENSSPHDLDPPTQIAERTSKTWQYHLKNSDLSTPLRRIISILRKTRWWHCVKKAR